jgi:hypothetical protein
VPPSQGCSHLTEGQRGTVLLLCALDLLRVQGQLKALIFSDKL